MYYSGPSHPSVATCILLFSMLSDEALWSLIINICIFSSFVYDDEQVNVKRSMRGVYVYVDGACCG